MALEDAALHPVNYSCSYLCSPHTVEPSNCFQWDNSPAAAVFQYSADIYGNYIQQLQPAGSMQPPASPYTIEEGSCEVCHLQQRHFSCGYSAHAENNFQRYKTFSNPQSPASSVGNTSPLSHLPYQSFDSYSNLSSPVDCSSSECSYNSSSSLSCSSSPAVTRPGQPPRVHLQAPPSDEELSRIGPKVSKGECKL